MTYYKIGQRIETVNGLKGEIAAINYKDGKVDSFTVKADLGEHYYLGERVFVLASMVKN